MERAPNTFFMASTPFLISFFPSSRSRGHCLSPSFLTLALVLSHFLNTLRERRLMHLPTKPPTLGLLSSLGAVQQLTATGIAPEWKSFRATTAGPSESHHHRPSGFSQSDVVRQSYTNKLSCPSESRAWGPSPMRPLSLQPWNWQSRPWQPARCQFFSYTRLEKKRNSLGLLRREAGEPWPSGRWVASLVAPVTFSVEIWNRLEIDAEQLVQTSFCLRKTGSPELSKQLLSSRPEDLWSLLPPQYAKFSIKALTGVGPLPTSWTTTPALELLNSDF